MKKLEYALLAALFAIGIFGGGFVLGLNCYPHFHALAAGPAAEQATEPASTPATESSPRAVPESLIKVIDWQLMSESNYPGHQHIVGSLKNESHSTVAVMVDFNLYDSSGAQVGQTSRSVHALESQGVWKFDIYLAQREVQSAKLVQIHAVFQ